MSDPNREGESFSKFQSLLAGSILPMVVKAAIELGLFEIMAAEEASDGSNLSAMEMASRLPTTNPEAASMIERMLCYLANHSVVAYSVVDDGNGNSTRAYGLTPIGKHFVPDQYGVSLAPQLLFVNETVNLASCTTKHQLIDLTESLINMSTSSKEGAEYYLSEAQRLIGISCLQLTVKSALEIGLFQVLREANDDRLSSFEIASRLSAKNPEAPHMIAPHMIERMLCFLANNDVVSSSLGEGKSTTRVFGLTPLSESFLPNEDGVSLAPLLLFLHDKVVLDSWPYLKDAILDGRVAFEKAHGMNAFEYGGKDGRYNDIFNRAMHNTSTITLKTILHVYQGFEDINEIVDVGGGSGAALSAIISKYPHIKGINFDLPHVIENARGYPGVEHVGGNMFEEVPNGETMLLKHVLHDWSDEHCRKILKNCWKSLPKDGKVIVVECLVPENPNETDPISKLVYCLDMFMMIIHRGKERTKKQFEALAEETGFTAKLICPAGHDWIIEFQKQQP